MTGTAKDVKYHVSDFLEDRHPYNVGQSYTAQRVRDQGKVFNGMMNMGIDKLLEALDDDSLEPVQKAVALRHLHAHSAAAEKKIALLRKDIVPRLVRLLAPGTAAESSPVIEALAVKVLRSLCILPQGAGCVIVQGGVDALTATLENRKDLEERDDARVAAASALSLIAGSRSSRLQLLGEAALQPDTELVDYDYAAGVNDRGAAPSPTPPQRVCDALVACVEHDRASPAVVSSALHALSQLTLERAGLQGCLIAGALRAVVAALERYAREDTWVYGESFVEAETVLHGAAAVWHLALDDVGQRDAAELPFVQLFGRLIAFVLPVKDKLLSLKAHLAGAVCALAMHPPLKQEAIAPLTNLGGEPASLLDLVLRLLQQATETYQPIYLAQKRGHPNPTPGVKLDQVAGIVKNCVQAVRLIVELPAARDVLLEQLVGRPETYELRRQLFYGTTLQDAFQVKPV